MVKKNSVAEPKLIIFGSGSSSSYSNILALKVKTVPNRAVDPHSFYADPDPAVFLNADPDPDPDPGPGPA